ncbi:MAG: accessory gene regulator B family protein [Coprococcus sp.]
MRLSEALSKSMTENAYITDKEYNIYEYCFDYLIEQLKYDILIIIFGILLHQPGISVTYIITFSVLRRYAGGYHAPNRWSCSIMSYLLYFLILISATHIHVHTPYIWFIIFIISIMTIIYMAPVSTPNKPLSDSRRKKMKLKAIISSILLLIAFTGFYISEANKYYVTIDLCVIMVLTGLIVQAIINSGKE